MGLATVSEPALDFQSEPYSASGSQPASQPDWLPPFLSQPESAGLGDRVQLLVRA